MPDFFMPIMYSTETINRPAVYNRLLQKAEEINFSMPSDLHIGSLLKTLIASKPGGRFLELGTGIGLSLSWMIEGMDETSELITLDNDPKLTAIAEDFFGKDERVEIVCTDGSEWILDYNGKPFDLIFADAWPGKYSEFEETLKHLKKGGFYVIDDMTKQLNWPEGHEQKAATLEQFIENHPKLVVTKLDWSTGVMICVKR